MQINNTQLGKIRGVDLNECQAFLGVRFGEPPTGPRRFMPPIATSQWQGTFDATSWPNRSMQPNQLGTMGQETPGLLSEDCLFLNLYRPTGAAPRRPVMVWIHGGGFNSGSANEYDGRVLASQSDVIVVTINYRLGPCGFLDLEPLGQTFRGSVSNGFRDMILVLQWVQDNIADYGGDADNVTIFGESAGAIAVLSLLAAPAADGLFHKVIANSPGAPRATKGDKTGKMAETLGVDKGSLLDTLRGMSAGALIDAGLPGGYTIDGAVITRDYAEAITDRGASGIPLIVGTNRTEGTLFTPPDTVDEDITAYENRLPRLVPGVTRSTSPENYLAGLKSAYPNLNAKRLTEIVSTDHFRRTAVEAAEIATTAGPGGWLYRFDLDTTKPFRGKLMQTAHACEMAFTFNAYADLDCDVFRMHDSNASGVCQLAQQWSSTLTRFAHSGDPNGAGLPEWPQYNSDKRAVMILDKNSRLEADPDAIHRALWV